MAAPAPLALKPPAVLDDAAIVALAAMILRDERAWAAACAGLDPRLARQAARRACRLMAEALETI